ncbi:FecR family protein [Chitinophaga ginsengisegetis]|uniref:FecR family protein n=1 Tax=Chitinophaga ginsengisegetis TaxID=393003 RepID=A0A1T5NVL6_9BACT|nr:FecR domain-containing protein [Chitinophaga ginsengisegetis]MDR6567402.1 ferric-dicitrate binding protein FerR (iron transport regulator) [Chitinophaga ginsengisegetis]MDR6647133.1 ferric-dicitrate binding protein FerR (iron transport regulator) [Chitinophaga ginsengisegetis]MDR6653482.1 ferric-dicitrate binding protein FerR (iron transport regulator) [Chitinophaga ginsengisegetis]SKD04495.1 FecR family protein [Chitinophaga ginsengisegetis]
MDEHRIHLLLTKLAGNTINEQEFEELMLLLRQAESDDAVQSPFDKTWSGLTPATQLSPGEARSLYDQIKENPRFSQTEDVPVLKPHRWLAYAAGILVLIGAGLAAWLLMKPSRKPALVYEEVWAPAGKRVRLVLEDSTEVWLNNGSKLRYPVAFTGNTRELYVEGEACFDVTRRDQQPFIVHSGNVAVKVLGTVFNIQAYQQAPLAVTVVSGKVSVAAGTTALGVLHPNEKLEYEAVSRRAKIDTVNAENLLAWKKGELIMDDVTMEQAAAIIGRWYNVQVELGNDAIRNCRFSLSFLHGESIGEVMKMICELNGCSWKMRGSAIIISGKGC